MIVAVIVGAMPLVMAGLTLLTRADASSGSQQCEAARREHAVAEKLAEPDPREQERLERTVADACRGA